MLGKISDVGNKLLPMAETVATGLGYGPKQLDLKQQEKDQIW